MLNDKLSAVILYIKMLTAIAEESRSIIKNVRWAFQRKFKQGDMTINTGIMFGYKAKVILFLHTNRTTICFFKTVQIPSYALSVAS